MSDICNDFKILASVRDVLQSIISDIRTTTNLITLNSIFAYRIRER